MSSSPTQVKVDSRKTGPRVGSARSARAYEFLCQAEREGRLFQIEELISVTSWTPSTARQYLNDNGRLTQVIIKGNDGLRVSGCCDLSLEDFQRMMSQNVYVARDPLKPALPPKAEELVLKAREAALAAVQHYNSPTAVFRSGNYVILMTIAYTAVFHAVFERDGKAYEETRSDGTPRLLGDGTPALWDAVQSAYEYSKLNADLTRKRFLDGLLTNLRFFKRLRDRFEHRDTPQVDPTIEGECQSMLMNFEAILVHEFTSYYSINSTLAAPLHFSGGRSPQAIAALKHRHTDEYDELRRYINEFRAGLSDDMYENPAFAFRVFLIPKPANEARRSDVAFEVVKYDPSDPNQREVFEKAIVAMKQSVRSVAAAGLLRPKDVVAKVASRLGKPFNMANHTRAWKHYQVRPESGSDDPSRTKSNHCVYNSPYRDYLYTEDWVEHLITELSDKDTYEAVIQNAVQGLGAVASMDELTTSEDSSSIA